MQDLKIVTKKLNFKKNIPKIKIGKNAILTTLITLTCASYQAQVRRVYSLSNTTMEIFGLENYFFKQQSPTQYFSFETTHLKCSRI